MDDAQVLVVGVGACEAAPEEEVLGLIRDAVRAAGLAERSIAELATVDVKAAEPGIVGAAARLGVPVVAYAARDLAEVSVPNPSPASSAAVGTPSVAEAAALRGGGELIVPKRKSAPAGRPPMATCAIVRRPARLAYEERPAAVPHGDPEPVPGPDLRHHGDAEVRDGGAGLTDLAVNVRSDTPPAWLKEKIAASLDGLAAYPDGRAAREAVAARHGLSPDRVLLTAGAAEAFVLLARALKVRHPVVVHPQFTEPEAALRDAGHEVERVLLREEDGFRLDAAAVERVPEAADLVVVGNPTNPTSVLHPAVSVTALARPGRILVVDEAFMDAVPGEREALAGRTDVPGLVVLRSLTKTWGLAGLRIGYVLASPDVIATLEQAQPLWPVSTPALVAAEACVTPRALAEAGHAAHRGAADRAHLLAGLASLAPRGVRVVGPAEGPFVLVRVPGAEAVRERLRGAGFAVRRGDTFPGLGPGWIRLAVRDRATTSRFVPALAAALGP
ncbi:Rv2231c family pyridoxal phosphate-dependent protein CobC [Streptomyces sp. A1499]|uniref:Rv2231c family pyridoxal phosphate-dependent protein CobC n=1 Tax=Streptomyces sp. A1499 TaxID=2563104 RepID=UPI00109E4DCE|nr:Rv2231c family pyridoxal phosphate-dependent protein CobC [Streptomyces sp. A1499]THC49004.1 threonine-phosphate decarboxylase [Streptomyces sp. A1499]